eukprot:scaffold36317_cov177-Isochrysis_galbana.AAC.4
MQSKKKNVLARLQCRHGLRVDLRAQRPSRAPILPRPFQHQLVLRVWDGRRHHALEPMVACPHHPPHQLHRHVGLLAHVTLHLRTHQDRSVQATQQHCSSARAPPAASTTSLPPDSTRACRP